VSATRNSILTPRAFRIWSAGIITTTCLLIAIAVGMLYAPALLKNNQSSSLLHPARPTHAHAPAPTPAPVLNIGSTDPVPPEYQQAAATTAQEFMSALLDHHYDSMWSLLHPRAKERAFAGSS
jgi:hypothetical protein